MFSRKRATDLTVEGVVIVVSILLAFALEAWWEAHGQRQEEIQILENLQVEFLEAGAQLDRYLVFHEATLGSIETILAAVRGGRAMGDSQVEVPTLDLARTFISPTFDPRTGTLDGLLHSGRGGILRSRELQKTLSGWPGLLAEATEEEARTDRLVFDQLEPILRTQMDISPMHLLPIEIQKEACPNMLFGRSCGDVNEEAEIPGRWGGTSSLPVDSQVSSLFAVRLQILSHGIDQFREVRDEVDRILELVAENLGR